MPLLYASEVFFYLELVITSSRQCLAFPLVLHICHHKELSSNTSTEYVGTIPIHHDCINKSLGRPQSRI